VFARRRAGGLSVVDRESGRPGRLPATSCHGSPASLPGKGQERPVAHLGQQPPLPAEKRRVPPPGAQPLTGLDGADADRVPEGDSLPWRPRPPVVVDPLSSRGSDAVDEVARGGVEPPDLPIFSLADRCCEVRRSGGW
jgi:hypothetical protein